MTIPALAFCHGMSPLDRLERVHASVVLEVQEGNNFEGKLASLVRSHPVFLLQFGISVYMLLSFALEWVTRSSASDKYRVVMRVQSLLCSLFINLLDVIMRMSVSGDVTITSPVSLAEGDKSSSSSGEPVMRKEADVIRKVDMTSLPVTKELLQRARKDMQSLAQQREGQGVAYAAIALACGAPAHSAFTVVLRSVPFVARALLLVLACAFPVPSLLEAMSGDVGRAASGVDGQSSDRKVAGKTKGKANGKGKVKRKGKAGVAARRVVSIGGLNIMHLLFPSSQALLPEDAPASVSDAAEISTSRLAPDTLDVLVDMLSLPIEFFLMRGWSKQTRPKPVAAAAAAPTKSDTLSTVIGFAVSMVKSGVVMAYTKSRVRTLLDQLDPPSPMSILSSNQTDPTSLGSTDASAPVRETGTDLEATIASPKVAVFDKSEPPFFMSRWPLFRDPVTRNIIAVVRQFIALDGTPRPSLPDLAGLGSGSESGVDVEADAAGAGAGAGADVDADAVAGATAGVGADADAGDNHEIESLDVPLGSESERTQAEDNTVLAAGEVKSKTKSKAQVKIKRKGKHRK